MTCSGPPREYMSHLLVQCSFHGPGRQVVPHPFCIAHEHLWALLYRGGNKYQGMALPSGYGASFVATGETDLLKLPPLSVQSAFLLPLLDSWKWKGMNRAGAHMACAQVGPPPKAAKHGFWDPGGEAAPLYFSGRGERKRAEQS